MRACSGQAGHDCADRDRRDVGDLLVGTLFQLTQGDDFAKLGRELLDRRAHHFAIVHLVEPAREAGIRVLGRV